MAANIPTMAGDKEYRYITAELKKEVAAQGIVYGLDGINGGEEEKYHKGQR
jgi:hypothetical protein